jgi:hypothetical protein
MKAQELRIGNLVNYGVNIVPIKSIHTESVLKDEVRIYVELNEKLQNYCLDITEIEPIPLTEERLLKFGVKDNRLGLFDVVKVSDDIGYHIYFIGRHLKEIQYVHQLQNLYFALTGEELILNS